MRLLALTLAATATLAGFAACPAEAQQRRASGEVQQRRPLNVTVRARTYLDAGPVVAVSSQQNYVTAFQTYSVPVYGFIGERFGESVLPGRLGPGQNTSVFGPFTGIGSGLDFTP